LWKVGMGGLCFKAEKREKQASYQPQPQPNRNRQVTVREEELVIAKLKIQADRLESRLKRLEGEEEKIQARVKALVGEGKKEEAFFWLRKLKSTKGYAKDARTKVGFVEGQIAAIENTLDDVQFAQTVKESNKAIESLSRQIDMDELRLAKELQEEGRLRREEIDSLLDDGEDLQDLKQEVDLIEKGMVEEAFRLADQSAAKDRAEAVKEKEKEKVKEKKYREQHEDEKREAMLN